MIINDKEAAKRLESPMNLINRLRRLENPKKNSAMSLFGIGQRQAEPEVKQEIVKTFNNPFSETPSEIPSEPQPPELDTILQSSDQQIKLTLAHDQALELLNRSVSVLSAKLDDVRADKIPQVIAAASKTVEFIRRERSERDKNNKGNDVHFHFYTPEQKKLESYEIIEVSAVG